MDWLLIEISVDLLKRKLILGYEMSSSGINISKSRIEAILEMKNPGNITELKSFLGIVGFVIWC